MKSNTELLKIAQKHLGQGGARFRKFAGLPSGAAWCNAFVDYVAKEGGVEKLYFNGKKETYCPHSIEWCKKNLAQIPLYLTLPMDIIYFDWDRNGKPNHIGFVREKKSATGIYTIEGNTDGGKVAQKTRNGKYVQAVYRPHFNPPAKMKKTRLGSNSNFAFYSIYNLQIALGMKPTGILTKETVKYLQRKCGASTDGAWGASTSKHLQTMLKKDGCYTGKIDSVWGASSTQALKAWINKVNYPAKKPTKKPTETKKPATKTPTKTTNAQKLLAKAKDLAWAYGTPRKTYDYKTGKPKASCKTAMKKYGWADNKAEMSDCGNFVSTIVRSSGVDKSFKALHGVKTPFPTKESKFNIVLKGKEIPAGFLKAGDIIRYKKTNGKQHAMMYFGDGKVCEASHKNFFGVIRKDEKRYKTQSKKSTIQVLRAKE
jgi:YD repeat-containing protein